MSRGTLADPAFKGQFSGHETFPLRYGWLNKVYDAAIAKKSNRGGQLFATDEAMVAFGVGKNMVSSMKYWSLATGIIEESDAGRFRTTEFADQLLGESGLDPYLEHPASLWLLHWKLAATPHRTTTWYWGFNHVSGLTFERDQLVTEISDYCAQRQWSRVSTGTLRRDVDCFIGTYEAGRLDSSAISEETLGSPLAELRLVTSTGRRGVHQFQRGPKPSLPDNIFAYAVVEFWDRHTSANSLAVEAITYEQGSPGRVFKLDEDTVAERLARIESATKGAIRWTDTAGVRQVVRGRSKLDGLRLIRGAYESAGTSRRAA